MYLNRIIVSSFFVLFCSLLTTSSWGQQATIKLGVSNATSGPTSQLGNKLNLGSTAYFSKINSNGGINGQRVEMIIRDDSYEPYITSKNTDYFLAQDDIFALYNFVGTPTSQAIIHKISQHKLLFLTPFTGAEFLREASLDTVFNLRASYFQEAKAQIDYLVKERNIKKIGLLLQSDQFGYFVDIGYSIAMKEYGIKPVVTTRYRRNTLDINWALKILQENDVEAVAFVGTYAPLAKLINLANERGFKPVYTSVSFISSKDLFALVEQPTDIMITEVMPDPNQCNVDICKQFKKDFAAVSETLPDRVHFEGYLNAYLFHQVAKQCGSPLTKQCYQKTHKQYKVNLSRMTIDFTQSSNQGLNELFMNFYQAN